MIMRERVVTKRPALPNRRGVRVIIGEHVAIARVSLRRDRFVCQVSFAQVSQRHQKPLDPEHTDQHVAVRCGD
jgi:hypothetical protein